MTRTQPGTRRHCLRLALLPLGVPLGWPMSGRAGPYPADAQTEVAPVIRPEPLHFPRDFGAHLRYRTEWWYLTGELRTQPGPAEPGAAYGFQITFFRSRVDTAQHSDSRFAVRQLISAHAALSDPQTREQLHDQRVARMGLGLVDASDADTRLALRGWSLQRQGEVGHSLYSSHIAARGFTLDLRCAQTQPVLLQGRAGFSQKAPDPRYASHYYTEPQLRVSGQLRHHGREMPVEGTAWLDHEWSEPLLHPDAVGWDWIGINLHDGSALTVFQLRRRDGSVLWRGGSWRRPGEPDHAFGPDEARMTPTRTWSSPATAARYPVAWRIDVPGQHYTLRARFDAQELDSRRSTGNVYWEGLSDLFDAGGQRVGSGYLEMTGYASAMTL